MGKERIFKYNSNLTGFQFGKEFGLMFCFLDIPKAP